MNMKLNLSFALTLGLLSVKVAHAEPPASVQIEINFLLGYTEGSRCEFYRNGTWHDSQSAQAHLRDKYKFLVARGMINTTKDFIEKAATESSFSGLPYEVKCNGAATVMSKQWLTDELSRFRSNK